MSVVEALSSTKDPVEATGGLTYNIVSEHDPTTGRGGPPSFKSISRKARAGKKTSPCADTTSGDTTTNNNWRYQASSTTSNVYHSSTSKYYAGNAISTSNASGTTGNCFVLIDGANVANAANVASADVETEDANVARLLASFFDQAQTTFPAADVKIYMPQHIYCALRGKRKLPPRRAFEFGINTSIAIPDLMWKDAIRHLIGDHSSTVNDVVAGGDSENHVVDPNTSVNRDSVEGRNRDIVKVDTTSEGRVEGRVEDREVIIMSNNRFPQIDLVKLYSEVIAENETMIKPRWRDADEKMLRQHFRVCRFAVRAEQVGPFIFSEIQSCSQDFPEDKQLQQIKLQDVVVERSFSETEYRKKLEIQEHALESLRAQLHCQNADLQWWREECERLHVLLHQTPGVVTTVGGSTANNSHAPQAPQHQSAPQAATSTYPQHEPGIKKLSTPAMNRKQKLSTYYCSSNYSSSCSGSKNNLFHSANGDDSINDSSPSWESCDEDDEVIPSFEKCIRDMPDDMPDNVIGTFGTAAAAAAADSANSSTTAQKGPGGLPGGADSPLAPGETSFRLFSNKGNDDEDWLPYDWSPSRVQRKTESYHPSDNITNHPESYYHPPGILARAESYHPPDILAPAESYHPPLVRTRTESFPAVVQPYPAVVDETSTTENGIKSVCGKKPLPEQQNHDFLFEQGGGDHHQMHAWAPYHHHQMHPWPQLHHPSSDAGPEGYYYMPEAMHFEHHHHVMHPEIHSEMHPEHAMMHPEHAMMHPEVLPTEVPTFENYPIGAENHHSMGGETPPPPPPRTESESEKDEPTFAPQGPCQGPAGLPASNDKQGSQGLTLPIPPTESNRYVPVLPYQNEKLHQNYHYDYYPAGPYEGETMEYTEEKAGEKYYAGEKAGEKYYGEEKKRAYYGGGAYWEDSYYKYQGSRRASDADGAPAGRPDAGYAGSGGGASKKASGKNEKSAGKNGKSTASAAKRGSRTEKTSGAAHQRKGLPVNINFECCVREQRLSKESLEYYKSLPEIGRKKVRRNFRHTLHVGVDDVDHHFLRFACITKHSLDRERNEKPDEFLIIAKIIDQLEQDQLRWLFHFFETQTNTTMLDQIRLVARKLHFDTDWQKQLQKQAKDHATSPKITIVLQ